MMKEKIWLFILYKLIGKQAYMKMPEAFPTGIISCIDRLLLPTAKVAHVLGNLLSIQLYYLS